MAKNRAHIDELMIRFGGECVYCGAEVERRWGGIASRIAVVEHVEPLSRGGEDTPENRVLACQACNTEKRDSLLLEWLMIEHGMWKRDGRSGARFRFVDLTRYWIHRETCRRIVANRRACEAGKLAGRTPHLRPLDAQVVAADLGLEIAPRTRIGRRRDGTVMAECHTCEVQRSWADCRHHGPRLWVCGMCETPYRAEVVGVEERRTVRRGVA